MKKGDLIMIFLGMVCAIALGVTVFIGYKIRKFLSSRDLTNDSQKMNEDNSCCICMENYIDDKGPIIPSFIPENVDSETPHDVTYTDIMPSNFQILQDLAAKNRRMMENNTSNTAMLHHINKQNKNQSEEGGNVSKDSGLVLGLLKCGHIFHFECIWKWMQFRTKCPICRSYTLMNQDDIKAVSLFAVFPDLDSKNRVQDYENNEEYFDLPDVHQSTAAKKEMSVFCVEKVGNTNLSYKCSARDSKKERPTTAKVDFNRELRNEHSKKCDQNFQYKIDINLDSPQQARGYSDNRVVSFPH